MNMQAMLKQAQKLQKDMLATQEEINNKVNIAIKQGLEICKEF